MTRILAGLEVHTIRGCLKKTIDFHALGCAPGVWETVLNFWPGGLVLQIEGEL
jgi:hypothetical protein